MIKEYKIHNKNGFSVTILSYGGIIKEINVPDKNGKIENIVLKYENNFEYLNDTFFIGALIGRYANRIENGTFVLNNKIINLERNEGKHHLHGGSNGFHKNHWDLKKYDNLENKFLELSFMSNHLDCGYPGNLKCSVKYSLNDLNEFNIEFYGISDADTIFNPTSHSYFNLNPSENSIFKHSLKINSEKYIPVDKQRIPIKSIRNVFKTPFDFILPKRINKHFDLNNDQLQKTNGYDHCFVLKKNKNNIAAELSDEISGRKLTIITDQPGIQLYSGNYLEEKFKKNQGICLETQNFPNSPNINGFPSSILNAGKEYYSITTYQFSLI